MPNTLAHFGVQALPWKLVDQSADVRWLGLGCIVPDIPWIVQRLAPLLWPAMDLINLRVYCMIQASLMLCLLIAGGCAALTTNPRRVFILLAGSSLAHLLLDAFQTKWASGVHLFAPISWHLLQFGWFWPESRVSWGMSIIGLMGLLFYWYRNPPVRQHLQVSPYRLIIAGFLFASYGVLPILLMSGPKAADNHFVATLSNTYQRSGKPIGFDRCGYDGNTRTIQTFSGESFTIAGTLPPDDATSISLKGIFRNNKTIDVHELHVHGNSRDYYSYAGLLLVGLLWANPVIRTHPSPKRG